MVGRFESPSRIVTGWGALGCLGEETAGLGRRALLVTGRRGLRQAGVTDRAVEVLRAAGVHMILFDQVEPEPGLETVDRGRALLADEQADVVIGLGGGSALDVAKAIAGLGPAVAGGLCAAEFHRGRPVPARGLPIVAVPTTSGSGSEVTPVAVLADRERQVKQSLRGEALRARVVIVDPELTVSMPPAVTASSGMDALTQAIESFWSLGATPLTEALSWEAIRLADAHLVRAFEQGQDRAAREAMAYASLMAGLALAGARLGAVHGIAHPLGWRYRIPHGVCCAALLPHVMRLNRQAAAAKYDRLAGLFGADPAEHVERLLDRLHLPRTLGAWGLSESDFGRLVADSMPSGSLKANPKPVTEEDVAMILKRLL